MEKQIIVKSPCVLECKGKYIFNKESHFHSLSEIATGLIYGNAIAFLLTYICDLKMPLPLVLICITANLFAIGILLFRYWRRTIKIIHHNAEPIEFIFDLEEKKIHAKGFYRSPNGSEVIIPIFLDGYTIDETYGTDRLIFNISGKPHHLLIHYLSEISMEEVAATLAGKIRKCQFSISVNPRDAEMVARMQKLQEYANG